jgi:hypothetical protein
MPSIKSVAMPEVFFRAPTYFIGGSNLPLHGRVGLFLTKMRLVFMMFALFRRIINNYMIEYKCKIILKIKYFSPPILSLSQDFLKS